MAERLKRRYYIKVIKTHIAGRCGVFKDHAPMAARKSMTGREPPVWQA